MSAEKQPYEIKDNVAIIYISDLLGRAKAVEGLSYELEDIFSNIYDNRDIKVVIITDGPGNPLNNEEKSGNYPGAGNSVSLPVSRVDAPVIAAVTGDATGWGLELIMACDIRVASEGSCFGLPQIKKGLIPSDGGTQRLSRLVGRGKAMEMILTGNSIDSDEAFRIGLINKIVSPDSVLTTAMDMAKEMCTKGPISFRYVKEAIYKGMDMTLEQGLRLEADLYMLIHTTRDRTEGIRAFQEKRKADFRGE